MKSFDLTFNGAVLPEHDPGQVKQDLARLLSIQDSTLIEEIFSGKTIVLRHNLDRKTAADYFRRISLLGGQAALVKSPKHRAVHRDEVLILNPDNRSEPQIPDTPVPEKPAETKVNRASGFQQSGSLESITAKTTQESQQMAARLQRHKGQFDRIATEELEKIKQLNKVNRVSVQKELAELSTIEETAAQLVSTKLLEVEKKNILSKNRANRDIARLDTLIEESRTDELAAAEKINQCLEDTQHSAEEEIGHLHQLLHDAQHRAAVEVAGLEQQLQEAKSWSQLEVEELEHQKNETLLAMKEKLNALEQQQEAAQRQFTEQTAELRQREQEAHTREREETSRLQAMEENIKSKRDQGIARVEQAISQLPTQTQPDLQQLQASNPEISCQQYSEAAAIK